MWYGSCLLSEWLWVTSKFGHLELKRSHPLKFKGVIWLMGYLYIYLGIWALTQCFFQVVFLEQWHNGSLSNNFKVSKCNELFSKAKLHLFSGKWSKGGEIFFFFQICGKKGKWKNPIIFPKYMYIQFLEVLDFQGKTRQFVLLCLSRLPWWKSNSGFALVLCCVRFSNFVQ